MIISIVKILKNVNCEGISWHKYSSTFMKYILSSTLNLLLTKNTNCPKNVFFTEIIHDSIIFLKNYHTVHIPARFGTG